MSIIGTNLAGSLAGAQSAERAESVDKQRRERRRAETAGATREGDSVVVRAETIDPVRDAKGNGEEEAHEDRQEHGLLDVYDRLGQTAERRPSIDVEG